MSNEFREIFEELDVPEALLTVLTATNRSTLYKYLRGQVDNIPATAITLMRLLQFLKHRDTELFKEWLVLQEMGTRPEHYLDNPQLYKVLKDSAVKFRPGTRSYLTQLRQQQQEEKLKKEAQAGSNDQAPAPKAGK